MTDLELIEFFSFKKYLENMEPEFRLGRKYYG